jgi:hypothetical protein
MPTLADMDIDITGLSYHIGHWSYPDAPRGLDKNGNFIFNPGLDLVGILGLSKGQMVFLP